MRYFGTSPGCGKLTDTVRGCQLRHPKPYKWSGGRVLVGDDGNARWEQVKMAGGVWWWRWRRVKWRVARVRKKFSLPAKTSSLKPVG